MQRLQKEMEAYVAEFGTSLVPFSYVSPSGHNLGYQLGRFRRGGMRKGRPGAYIRGRGG